MSNHLLLEVCVETVDHAIAAERGGAQRIELCSDLPSGGITPSAGLMQSVRQHVGIPVHVLIRPRAGDFIYSDHEFETMRNDVRAAQQFGMNGVVLGILLEDGRVDVERTSSLVKLAKPFPVTFHRAFDASENFEASLEDVLKTGCSRILTSGGRARAMDALPTLTRLVQLSSDRIVLMPGGSINSENVVKVAQATMAQEFHTSVGTSLLGSKSSGNGSSGVRGAALSDRESALFEKKVAELVGLLHDVSREEPVN